MKKKMTFEQSLDRLEEIAAILEQGNAPLEESLRLYEEASGLAAQCQKQLADVQVKISELSDLRTGNADQAGSEEEDDG